MINDIRNSGVMSEPFDMMAIKILLDQMQKPLRGLELGTGGGGWVKALRSCNVAWTLVDDFSWAAHNEDVTWATNAGELRSAIEEFDDSIKVEDIHAATVQQLIENNTLAGQFDFIRIDCDIDYDEMNYFLTLLAPNGLVFIDDSKLNCGFLRVLLGIKAALDGNLVPVWYGFKESLYANNQELSSNLGDKLFDIVNSGAIEGLYTNKEYKKVDDKEWTFVTTTNYGVYT